MKKKIERAKGKLGILMHGLGAAATTFIAGVEAVKKGWAEPSSSLTQTGIIRLDRKAGSSMISCIKQNVLINKFIKKIKLQKSSSNENNNLVLPI